MYRIFLLFITQKIIYAIAPDGIDIRKEKLFYNFDYWINTISIYFFSFLFFFFVSYVHSNVRRSEIERERGEGEEKVRGEVNFSFSKEKRELVWLENRIVLLNVWFNRINFCQ